MKPNKCKAWPTDSKQVNGKYPWQIALKKYGGLTWCQFAQDSRCKGCREWTGAVDSVYSKQTIG